MITTLLLTVFLGFFNFIVALLPTTGLPAAVNTNVAAFFQSVYGYNHVFPIDTAITLIGYAAAFWVIILLWHILKFFVHLVRGN